MAAVHLARPSADLERIETRLLLEGIYEHYGFDFRGYAWASLKRRLWRRVDAEGVQSLSGLQERVLHDPDAMERLLRDLSINVTSMFRDPTFFSAFREHVVPLLKTYPFVRIWNAGCSTGEETCSLAIILSEEGLYERSRIYATDINEGVLAHARSATYPLDRMRDYTENYIRAGGTESFSAYYEADGQNARFDPKLLEQVVFAQHNLVSDGAFNHFNVIVCRNVMIYFGKPLQERVHELFHESLETFGVLALGHKETMRFSAHAPCYEELDPREKLYRKVR
ncbi:MAG: protein-glutamate O-methyltransferase CheR [Actinomycetota bacterium]|nr:protein-glutamate O-methyltransferase CheR [Actinomycetota bacterium]